MWKAKRRGDHLTRSFHKSKRASKNESMLSGRFLQDSDQVVLSGLSDRPISYLSKIVASITLYKGNIMFFSCSGIAIERQGCHLTRFLTSASLARALNSNEDRDDWKIEVRPEGNEVYMGVMSAFDLDRNFVVVSVHGFLDVQVGSFQYALQIPPHGEILVAIGRAVSGEIIVKNVEFEGDPIVLKDDEDLDCRISEAWEGGPLASVDGKVVGINLFLTTRRAVFVPCGTILKHLKHYLTSQQKKAGLAQSKTTNVYRFGARPIGEESNSYSEVHENFLNQKQLDLEAMGYPKLPSSMSGAGMILANTFEETFGDIHGEGVWRKFSKKASNINRNVVALASFNGGKRFFACTGFFIEWNESTIILTSASLVRSSGDENKIADNLRIQVLLNSQCREGMLQHYNLHYNVALVSVKDYPTLRPSKTLLWWNRTFEVAAIGRCFKTGALMATTGDLVCWTGTLDCDFLATSTCKITKAGIGGPLVSLDGDVIGMNFYDKRIGTPFLGLSDIYRILALFETKSKPGEHLWKMDEDEKTKPNRWPVPMPRWCNEDEDKSDDDDEDTSDDDELGFDPKYGPVRYSYDKGMKVRLC
ncbi:uncharacterized protein LOC124677472 [Lolium rigidum]|uniref:uncharacterized protein LOC124677472 n=1 Tax=Lolium rigidum TaxID=89674 RepID=UPI001F5D15FB|nr:uncharacterized protein LOC124677472 [Lolium rigidum]XP_047069415.1 uncharacterized protein LOC124677472 [Lolium rigidum]XP_047069416.1 uncharacterized protein LOC124677472 [Lolium rigidum]